MRAFVDRWGWPVWALIALFFCVGNVRDADWREAVVTGAFVVLFAGLALRERVRRAPSAV